MTATSTGTDSPGTGANGRKLVGDARPRKALPNTRRANAFYVAKLVVGIFLLPFWPVIMAVEAKDAYYVNHYFLTLHHCVRTLLNAIKNQTWTRIFKYNVFLSTKAVEESLGERMGACTRCAKCCKMLQCDYLAYDQKSHEYFCSVYNTPFWVFGACGRYPIDQTDIDDYNCPGFAFPESVALAEAKAARARASGLNQPGGLIQIGKLPSAPVRAS